MADERDMMDDEEDDTLQELMAEPRKPSATPAGADASDTFMGRTWALQHRLEAKWQSLGSGRFARVLRMARKPEPEEYRQSAIIVLVGIGVIGGLGFLTYLVMTAFLKLLTGS